MRNKWRKIRVAALLAALLGLASGCGQAGTAVPTDGDASRLSVYCFSAGKADAFLLYTEHSAVLIDTGESGFGKTVVAKLQELGITKLDYLIITHFDKDHVGGAKKILESVEVGTVLQSNCPKDANAYNNYVAALATLEKEALTVRQTLCFTLDGVQYTVDPPAREQYEKDASNNSSLIVSVSHGSNRFLFMGDAEQARLEEFLSQSPGVCDFLKVPYHGHWQSILTQLLAEVSPTVAVITSSEEEPEDARTKTALTACGAEVWLTRDGPFTVVSDGSSLTVQED